jgi:hypothetical protein
MGEALQFPDQQPEQLSPLDSLIINALKHIRRHHGIDGFDQAARRLLTVIAAVVAHECGRERLMGMFDSIEDVQRITGH